mmetsp:Transcript_10080/g.33567  ORF Transcript_10080/g.33567 Transcript_10080/m.33567 type:complete len:165 (-) Transcript_10080:1117-1611(-)
MPSATVQRNIITNPEQLRKNVRRCMRKLLDKNLVSSDPNVNAERQIEFAWSLVDWRTFDPSSPLKTFPGDAANKEPSALELLILALKNSPSAEVHYASSSAIAYLAVRQDIRLALVETPSGPLMESLDLLIRRLEATEHSGLRYAICAIATELFVTLTSLSVML